MNKQAHILNGDILKERFPKNIEGDLIVMRECLVDGDVNGKTLLEFYQTRSNFLHEHYELSSPKDYYEISVSEFQRMEKIPKEAEINLWFEDDLFCQVNFWFVIHLIYSSNLNHSVFLIRPQENYKYNFGGMTNEELTVQFRSKQKIEFSDLNQLKDLWRFYQNGDIKEMMNIATLLEENFPFLKSAIKAHEDRIPQDGEVSRPVQTLIDIMNELQTTEFEPIFEAFSKRANIYGFGDLQVKRLLKQIDRKN